MSNPVYDLLVQKGHAFRSSGQDYLIHCLNPEHPDNNPSLRIDQISGLFKCPSCGFKGNIFRYYNILSTATSIKVAGLKSKLSKVKAMLTGLDFPKGTTPFTNNFRKISHTTLEHFEAFITHEVPELECRVVFPIRDILGKIQAFQARHTLADAQPKYVVWPKTSELDLFPQKINSKLNYIVLVEGLFDMLNCYDKGLKNVTCMFGVTNLIKDAASKLQVFKTQGVTHIFVMLDGDKAGKYAAKQILENTALSDFIIEIIELNEDVDPGGMSAESINYYKEYIDEKSGNN